MKRPWTLGRQIWAYILTLIFVALRHEIHLLGFDSPAPMWVLGKCPSQYLTHLSRASWSLSLLSVQPKYPPSHLLTHRPLTPTPSMCLSSIFFPGTSPSLHTPIFCLGRETCLLASLFLKAFSCKPLTCLHFKMDFWPFVGGEVHDDISKNEQRNKADDEPKALELPEVSQPLPITPVSIFANINTTTTTTVDTRVLPLLLLTPVPLLQLLLLTLPLFCHPCFYHYCRDCSLVLPHVP